MALLARGLGIAMEPTSWGIGCSPGQKPDSVSREASSGAGAELRFTQILERSGLDLLARLRGIELAVAFFDYKTGAPRQKSLKTIRFFRSALRSIWS
jgi:hypothetical protein